MCTQAIKEMLYPLLVAAEWGLLSFIRGDTCDHRNAQLNSLLLDYDLVSRPLRTFFYIIVVGFFLQLETLLVVRVSGSDR